MSNETSANTGKLYGLQRVCQTLGFPRSSIYAERARATVIPITRRKRGPKPRVADDVLLQAIRDETARADTRLISLMSLTFLVARRLPSFICQIRKQWSTSLTIS
ncbi:MAG TPA: hypothetical protein VJU59_21885 [Paraburkholderia sp.]|uniref:hypothetical protein n=1 Tax=Paraburkholderia sp. TaxID=1926495 RepID=UPI002B47561C|nr:hypothetical protein [Paraburkholderia sp.]HKR42291.1 hypothetical protein [Paraburkholderia sp.]